jgi:hypothetical protein
MTALPLLIGRVTRSSTLGYTGAVRLPEPDVPVFGSYCQAEAQRGQSQVIGLIYNLSIEDDAFARQVATAQSLTPEQLADTQINRQVPIEFSALTIGYREGDEFHYTLPPQPPMTLAPIQTLPSESVRAFSRRLDFLPLILNAPEIPIDELVAAALRLAAVARPESERRPFLVEAGRECARLLAHDLTRLENLLRNLRP